MNLDNMELWNAYDNCFRIIEDITIIRGNITANGYYYLVCEVQNYQWSFMIYKYILRNE